MKYRIKEIYFTQQGEGKNTGKDFVFVRFAGRNLWSGKEKHRASAICNFCDTDFYGTDGVNGGVYEVKKLIDKIESLWVSADKEVRVVLTGGEPLLQVDDQLVKALKEAKIYIAIETNGTLKAPEGIDWICMSPKANTTIELTEGSEIKVIYPQKNLNPIDFNHMKFTNYYIQPLDSKDYETNVSESVKFCMQNSNWRLSLQTHKILGIK